MRFTQGTRFTRTPGTATTVSIELDFIGVRGKYIGGISRRPGGIAPTCNFGIIADVFLGIFAFLIFVVLLVGELR
jgi:hypothetical protein